MKFQPYPVYESLTDEWIGKIPNHWDFCSLRWLAKIFSGGTPDKSNLNYWTNGSIPWLASGEVNQKYITQPTTFITEEALKNSSAKWVKKNSLLMAIAGQGKTKGTISQLGFRATCNQSMAAIEPKGIHPRYLFYWLESNYKNIRGLAGDGLRDGLNLEMLGSIKTPIPTEKEQKQIAAFLDRETAAIDTLIAKQERLIALLEEKRQAVISSAVTKGLDPNVEMKDSGVEWLGEVPSHWEIKQLRYITKQLGGGTPSKDNLSFWNGDIPWVSPKDMKVNYISDAQDKITLEAVKHSSTKLIPIGSILIVVRGMILIHSVPVALTKGPLTINQDMKALLPSKLILGEYLLLILLGFRDYILDLVDNSAHGTRVLRTELLERISIPFPSLEEQNFIIIETHKRIKKLDHLIRVSYSAINLLKERHTTLISAAVTGKIDVRNLVE